MVIYIQIFLNKHINMKRILFPLLSITILLISCKKDVATNYSSNVNGELVVEFDNVVGSSDLQLNTGTYTNATGETFNVSKLKYYVSNFILTKTDGTVYTVPQGSCYFLVDESDPAVVPPETTAAVSSLPRVCMAVARSRISTA